ncbi:MAG: diphthine synthase [Candidatus Micrarchaeota archaeon]|nr:diphthine synthase [Candidatus Micrarchaeota archaeon]
MLFLIGIGLNNRDIPYSAADDLSGADEVLVDQYTNFITDEDLAWITSKFQISPKLIHRSDLEENAKVMVEKAKEKDIVLLVSGDPLIATTHHTILDLAAKKGVEYKIYHSSNIFSGAIGESGLDIYKFGPTTTITFWSEKYKPTSFIDVVKKNFENGQHTMCLCDYHYNEKRRMKVSEAIELLHVADETKGYGFITEKSKILVLGDVGKDSQEIRYLQVGKINKEDLRAFEGKVITLIVPGPMNFAEEEALQKFTAPTSQN